MGTAASDENFELNLNENLLPNFLLSRSNCSIILVSFIYISNMNEAKMSLGVVRKDGATNCLLLSLCSRDAA